MQGKLRVHHRRTILVVDAEIIGWLRGHPKSPVARPRPELAKMVGMCQRSPRPEEAHDVLAADEFAMPAADPDLHHGPVSLPGDPSGDSEPHDILAAEEFPMPA